MPVAGSSLVIWNCFNFNENTSKSIMVLDADVIIVGGGLSGLVAANEAISSGLRVLLVEQEAEQSLGGQAFWSLGGLFLVDTPLQRRMGIRDSYELAFQDWMGTAGFDRREDEWPRKWAEAYIGFAAGEKYSWLRGLGIRFFPIVGWAERGGGVAAGRGNSVPRFHVTWGTGPGVLEPFVAGVGEAVKKGMAKLCFRHQVDGLIVTGGVVTGSVGLSWRRQPSEGEWGARDGSSVSFPTPRRR